MDASFDRLINRRRTSDADDDVWLAADGRYVAIKDMTDSHIVNTLRMIERKVHKAWMKLNVVPSDVDAAMRQTLDVCTNNPHYRALVEEATRRELTWRK